MSAHDGTQDIAIGVTLLFIPLVARNDALTPWMTICFVAAGVLYIFGGVAQVVAQ